MNIGISPVAVGLIVIIITNCIMSFGKSKLMKMCHILISTILSAIGIIGVLATRPQLVSRISRSAERRDFDTEFVAWAIAKFDSYAVVSIALTCLFILILLGLLFMTRKNRSGLIWSGFSGFIIMLMIINLFAGVFYSIGAINKLFDVAFYIGVLSIYEILALYIPLVARRIIMLRDEVGGNIE